MLPEMLLLALPMSCQAGPRLDSSRVSGQAKTWVQIRGPFLAEFEKDGVELDYVAGAHEFTESGPTVRLVTGVFEKNPPEFVVIEGLQASAGVSPKSFASHVRQTCANGRCQEGEVGFATLLAVGRGIPFQGGEPDGAETTKALAAAGYSSKDWLLFDFLRGLGWRKSRPDFRDSDVPPIFAEIQARPEHSDAREARLADWPAWYEKATGKQFDLKTFDARTDETPRPDGTMTQRMSEKVDEIRNRRAVAVIDAALRSHKRVLVVYGRGHYDAESPVLKEALGEPNITPAAP